MTRNILYSAVVFFMVFCLITSGALTQFFMGAVKSDDLFPFYTLGIFFGLFATTIFYFLFPFIASFFRKLTSLFGINPADDSQYKPGLGFAAISVSLIILPSLPVIKISYLEGKEQLVLEQRKKESEERLELARKRVAEAEQKRLASMTPEERAAEDKLKREKAEAAVKERAQREAAALKESKKKQAEREKFIQGLISAGVFQKVDPMGGTIPKIFVRPAFYQLDFDQKQAYVSVVYAYYFDNDVSKQVILRDSRSGKDVGRFAPNLGGLKMD